MLNFEKFEKAAQPTEVELKDFASTTLFDDLDGYLRVTHKIKPKIAYSSCAMDNNIWRGWHIKYQKSGKSICTLYPQDGYFMVLIPGKWFEVRTEETISEVKFAVECRFDEITAKKNTKKVATAK